MNWTYEIALRGSRHAGAAPPAWFESGPRGALARLPGLASFDLYTPAEGDARDPYNQDGAGPLMIFMLAFTSRDALMKAIRSGGLAAACGSMPAGLSATGAPFERRFYPVGDASVPAPLAAPFSYVVRYHRPADDEAAFINNYVATHPTTQAKLPGIRSIMCYLPLTAAGDPVANAAHNLPMANYLIGNEVVFDDIDSFNAAMASPVRQELRAHFNAFPRFTGGNTHYPMTRTRLTG